MRGRVGTHTIKVNKRDASNVLTKKKRNEATTLFEGMI